MGENAAPAVTLGLCFQAALPIASGLRMTIHPLQTQDSKAGPQELKYPGPEARCERMGAQVGAAEGGQMKEPTRSALGAAALDRVIGTCLAEGRAQQLWRLGRVHLHNLGSSVATHTKSLLSSVTGISWNGIFVFTNDCSAASS